jgi:anti-anti-sigma factor
MKIEQQQVGTVDVFTPVGALVDQDGETFIKTLSQRLKSANARVVVAMHDVPYVDSMALEGLLTATEDLQERASSLKLAAVTPTCREILELTGLSSRFRFFKDVHDAVKSFL